MSLDGPWADDHEAALIGRLLADGRLTLRHLSTLLAAERTDPRPLRDRLVESGVISSEELDRTRLVPTPTARGIRSDPASDGSGPGPAPAPSSSADLVAGRRVGRYVLIEQLGRGGMGVVFRAHDPALDRQVAIKMLLDRAEPGQERERFEREARAAARLEHPSIVSVYEVGVHEGRPYLVMKYVAGESLQRAAQEGRGLEPRRAAELVRDVARALDYAHAQGVLHRDVKPSNVLLARDGAVLLTDFGLARDVAAQSELTATGQVLGTPPYMAPEQADGESGHGPFTDVYGLGALLYWTLVGRPPFEGDSALAIIKKVLFAEPVAPRALDPTVHADLETVALKCLEKTPAARYASAGEVADELDRFLAGRGIAARPLGRIARAGRWARRNRLATAALALAVVGLATGAAALVAARVAREREVRAERARFLRDVAERADRTRRDFAGACEDGPPASARTPEQERAAHDRRLALGVEALGAAMAHRALASEDEAVRRDAYRVAMQLGEVALAAEQWSVAAGAFDQAAELAEDTDATAAREARATVETRRQQVARAHRLAVEKVLERARSGELLRTRDGYEDGVYELTRYPEQQTVDLIIDELDRLTAELRETLRRTLLSAEHPNDDERLARAESIEGLREAIDLMLAHRLGEAENPRATPVLERALERLYRRQVRARREVGARVEAIAWDVLVPAQAQAVGEIGMRTAVMCCEALGRIGIAEGAVEALERYLYVQMDQHLAAPAGEALCRIGGPRAHRVLLAARNELGMEGAFWQQVSRLLAKTGLDSGMQATTADEHVDRAGVRFDQGDFEGAISDCDRAIELDPTTYDAWNLRGLARYRRGELDVAAADLDRAIEIAPTRAPAYMNRGVVRLERGDLDGALADLDAAIERDVSYAMCYSNRGIVRRRRGELEGALADYGRAIALAPADARNWINRGTLRREMGDLDGSIADLTRALDLDPTEALAWRHRGLARVGRGDLEGAIDDYGRAVELDPSDVSARLDRARVRHLRGELEAALADATHAVEIAPDELMAWLERGGLELSSRNLVAARADADRAIALAPGDARGWHLRARVREAQGDPGGALADIARAIELDPEDGALFRRRGQIRLGRADARGALADFDRAIELEPGSSDAWCRRAGAHYELGELDAALADADRAVALEPDRPGGWTMRARIRRVRGDVAGAVADLGRALEADPGEPTTWTERGIARLGANDLAGAREDFTRAIEIDPRLGEAWFNRGAARWKLGDIAGAIADLQRFVELEPTGPRAAKARALIDHIERGGR